MLSAGQRSHRVRFERRVPGADDGAGNVLPASWTSLFLRWAAFRPQFGREKLAAGRPESTMSGTLTILSDGQARTLTAADRVVFVTGPYRDRECQIRSILPTPDAREIEMVVEAGVAT
ncbi:MAG: hypothetical protein DI527_01015 [Chelatococcus sp.]|nr:MAG: hypothetical protein DI527_01015 [Chelatococcus sp.]